LTYIQVKKIDMELKEFIKNVLVQLTEGYEAAIPEMAKYGAVVNPAHITLEENQTIIDFDVLVSTTETGNTQGKAGIFVAGSGIGGKKESGNENFSSSRIKFSLKIELRNGDRDRLTDK
tara:strand:+ start:163925 stop:164281 length:357 start_codon:yes stop_codon:yes gene_type:complete